MSSVKLRVKEAPSRDVGRGIARIDPEAMETLDIRPGDLVTIDGDGEGTAVVKVLPAEKKHGGKGVVQMDGVLRNNAGAGLDSSVTVEATEAKKARRVVLEPLEISPRPEARNDSYVRRLLLDTPLKEGNKVRANLFGSGFQNFRAVSTRPKGPVIIDRETDLSISEPQKDIEKTEGEEVSYEDVGGLDDQLKKIREMIELPLKFPQLFHQLGIDPPTGVLLHGAPGTGKTLIARAVSNETDSEFFLLNGPEIMNKFYGESEARLRRIFEKAQKNSPSIIFIDEIDAICPKREEVRGDVEKRVVSQLLALMDGLQQREQVVVIGATNIPDVLDPALRRGGRFDRELPIPIPSEEDREEILRIHTRGMPLDSTVDLGELSRITHGFVGADLAALARESAMNSLKRVLPDLDLSEGTIPYEKVFDLKVSEEDFEHAFREVEPSATREVFVENPNVGWEDVGGLNRIKKKLRQTIEWPLKHGEVFDYLNVTPPSGILLYGPPGTGKTLLAKALASESRVNFISVRGPELFSMYVGESEKKVREIFKKARQASPCIIFFDEIDALVTERGGFDSGSSEQVTGQILNELDGLKPLQGVTVIGATNRKDLLDDALLRPGRLELHLETEKPDLVDRKEIFKVHTRGMPVEEELDYEELALDTEGFNGAEIEYVCRETAMAKMEEFLDSKDLELEDLKIKREDFTPRIERIKEERDEEGNE